MNQPPGNNQTTTTDLNSTLTQLDSQTLLNSTAEQADLQTFVESFPLNSPKLPSTQSASAHEISTVEPNLTTGSDTSAKPDSRTSCQNPFCCYQNHDTEGWSLSCWKR